MSKNTLNLHGQLPITCDDLLIILKKKHIDFKLYEHKPLFSVDESKLEQKYIFPKNINSVHIKNFYLRDKKKNNFLFTCEQDKKINLKILSQIIRSDRLSFGSSERLLEHLGVLPGAVSPFCMLNGIKSNVKFFCDYNLKEFEMIFLHPFVNNKTVCMDINDLEKFLNKYHININWIRL